MRLLNCSIKRYLTPLLKKSFGEGNSKIEVLKDINLSVDKGEFVVLLGPSGSGKSTLLNIIGGIDRAIVKNPDILLCDEPTGALDYNTSKEILALIEEMNQKYGNTVIMVTHNDAIKNMADFVVKLRDGVIRKSYRNETKMTASELDW